jgi:hypothetical protein
MQRWMPCEGRGTSSNEERLPMSRKYRVGEAPRPPAVHGAVFLLSEIFCLECERLAFDDDPHLGDSCL